MRMRRRTMRRVIARFTWDRLKVNFWFTPLVMSLGAFFLARLLNWVDMRLPNAILEDNRLVLSTNPVELRRVLISMATSILGTAGVVFSLLHIPLSTVANQFGSRLLRIFLADRTTQIVVGMYAATFVYCITAASSIPLVEVDRSNSQVMYTVAILLMLATTTSLIVLIQHISTMLQAPHIAAAAGEELREVVRAESLGEVWSGNDGDSLRSIQSAPETLLETNGYPVRARRSGYLEYIDLGYILALARGKDLVIRLLYRPGQFIWQDGVAALVWPAVRVDRRAERQIHRAFAVGGHRQPTQDIEYAINQLVEIAVRAMSSGSRDPFTAMTCLDHLGDSLSQFASQGEISSNFYDRDGCLRFIIQPVTFAELLHAAFDMLRHVSRDNPTVLLKMLEVIDAIGRETESPAVRQELLQHVCLIEAESQKGALIQQDLQLIHLRSEALREKFSVIDFAKAP